MERRVLVPGPLPGARLYSQLEPGVSGGRDDPPHYADGETGRPVSEGSVSSLQTVGSERRSEQRESSCALWVWCALSWPLGAQPCPAAGAACPLRPHLPRAKNSPSLSPTLASQRPHSGCVPRLDCHGDR